MRDDLPADIFVDALVYDDRDPAQVIAHVVLCHRHDDPPDWIASVDPAAGGSLGDPLFRKKLIGMTDAPSLRSYLDRGTESAVGVTVRGLRFTIRLEPWLSLDLDHTRIAHGIMETYRYDLFTEEQHHNIREEAAKRRQEKQSDKPAVG